MSQFTDLEEKTDYKKVKKSRKRERGLKSTKASAVIKKSRESIALLVKILNFTNP
jgi:hypothetical protein